MGSGKSPRGRPKGIPKTGGRKRGTPNKVTTEAKAACALIVDDLDYRKQLKARALAGTLPPGLEAMLWHYAKGRPVQRHEIKRTGDLTDADLELIASGQVEDDEG